MYYNMYYQWEQLKDFSLVFSTLNLPLLDLFCRWRRNWRKIQCMRRSPWNRSGSDFLRSISWYWRTPVVITTPRERRGSRSTNDPDPDLWVITLLQTIPICESLHCYKWSRSMSHYNITNNPDLWVITILQIIPICESLQYYKWSRSVSHYNITNDPHLWVITISQMIPLYESLQYYELSQP